VSHETPPFLKENIEPMVLLIAIRSPITTVPSIPAEIEELNYGKRVMNIE
jgi:hypothetical protein